MKLNKYRLTWQEIWPWLTLVGFVVISRWWLKAHYLFHHDSVQFALALSDWDIIKHQPHPPGYILYLGLAKLLNFVIHDANLVFIILSILATLLGLWAVAWLANQWWGRLGGIIAGILYVTNASVWFHGLIAEVYIVEMACMLWVVAFAYYYWRHGRTSDLIWLGLILGLLGGVRQIGELVLLPLVGYVVWSRHRFSWPMWGRLLGGLLVGNLLWFLPLLWLSGGISTYWHALSSLWQNTVIGDYHNNHWATPVKHFSLLIQTIIQSSPIIFAILGLGALPYIASESRARFKLDWSKIKFWLWWLCPSVVLLSLILMTNPGYALAVIVAVILLVTGAIMNLQVVITRWQPQWSNMIIGTIVLIAVSSQIWSFFTTPTLDLSYGSASLVTIREADRGMEHMLQLTQRSDINPANTIVLVDGGYLVRGFRHMQYYLPKFNVYGFFRTSWPNVTRNNDKFIYAHGPQTFISADQVNIPGGVTKIIVLGDKIIPDMGAYLSILKSDTSQYTTAYFDLTRSEVRQFLLDSKYFNFLTS